MRRYISIRTPARGVTRSNRQGSTAHSNFNSHPRAGGDFLLVVDGNDGLISIRTPARGVTTASSSESPLVKISIRTPARGVTPSYPSSAARNCHFNSHPRAGGDRAGLFESRHGRDFNSHPRAGGDDAGNIIDAHAFHFNSHPRAGGDAFAALEFQHLAISIRTPARGVTGAFVYHL